MRIVQPVKGTRDFYPEDMAFRNWLREKVKAASETFGYQEMDGPYLEPIELYAAKSGEELVKEQSFVFPDRGGDQIALRPELTPSLARMVASRLQQLVMPVRWWSFGPFWRYERPQKGRSREFFQWNIDLVGVDSPQADAELAAVACAFLKSVGLTPQMVQIQINNRRLMDQELAAFGLEGKEDRGKAYRWIDKRDKMEAAEWAAYGEKLGLQPDQIAGIRDMLGRGNLWEKSPELQAFFSAADALGIRDYLVYNAAVIRGLDYYTGTVFEARDTSGEFRAILGGGRYDNLVADIGGDKIAGVGFAMGDVVIRLVIEKYGQMPKPRLIAARVLVTNFSDEEQSLAMEIAAELRVRGVAAVWYPSPAKLPKQLKYADGLGLRYAVILGPDEARERTATVKDLAQRSQFSIAREKLADELIQRLAAQSAE